MLKVNILGTEYSIMFKSDEECLYLKECDGFCDQSRKEIVIANMKPNPDTYEMDIEYYRKKVIRHEIIHAFFYESGLWENSDEWDARSEALTDWIALQFPKMLKAFQEADCL